RSRGAVRRILREVHRELRSQWLPRFQGHERRWSQALDRRPPGDRPVEHSWSDDIYVLDLVKLWQAQDRARVLRRAGGRGGAAFLGGRRWRNRRRRRDSRLRKRFADRPESLLLLAHRKD